MNGCVLLFCKPDRTSGSFVGILRKDVLNMGKFSFFLNIVIFTSNCNFELLRLAFPA